MNPPSVGAIDEIVIRIISHFSDIVPAGDWSDPSEEEQYSNRQALVSSAMVNHAWHNASQKLLYHTIFASYHEEYCKEIATILEEHERLLDHVRVLRLSSDWLSNWWPIGWKAFSKIPNLEELEVHFEYYPTEEQAEDLWQAISRSTELRNVKKLIVHGYNLPGLAAFRSHLGLFHQIEHLEVRHCNMSTGDSELVRDTTEAKGTHPSIKPTLQSFKWMLNFGAPTHELDPMSVIAWFDVSNLTELSLESTAAAWEPILSLCTQAKGSLRTLHITYFDPGTDEREAIPNSALPNLLELASQLSNTASTFVLHGTSLYLIDWIQQSSSEADLALLDPRRIKLSGHASEDPPTNLRHFADTLVTLRGHVNVEFTFETYNQKQLLAAAPLLSTLIEEGVVIVNMMYHSEPGSPEPGANEDGEVGPDEEA